ncbi:conjugal transfer protein TrbC [Kribbella antibiotica]|uniref:Conjugal transfer protein TrbC n=2 Tax=Kribbella antibiotica TaxID=190195 RepID=A0A4R4ZVY9_9ACTN|nr:conjugal transfer protein TrbC [Kribbella antibiotica]
MLAHLISEIPSLLPMGDGPGTRPPGAEKLDLVIDWIRWIAFSICILGILIAGAMMAVGQRRGEGGEHAARLGWVLAACVVIGSASLLVGQLKT